SVMKGAAIIYILTEYSSKRASVKTRERFGPISTTSNRGLPQACPVVFAGGGIVGDVTLAIYPCRSTDIFALKGRLFLAVPCCSLQSGWIQCYRSTRVGSRHDERDEH